MRAAGDLLTDYQHVIESLTLVTGSKGVFDVEVDGELLSIGELPGVQEAFGQIRSVSYFGGPVVAMPFLLDTFRLPADMFQLFIVTGVYCSRVGDILGVMYLFALTVLGASATQGLLRIRIPKLLPRVSVSVALMVIVCVGLRGWLAKPENAGPSKDSVVEQMQLLRHPTPAVVRTDATRGWSDTASRA